MSTRIKPAFIYSDRGRPYALIGESLAFQGEGGKRLWVCWMKPAIGQVSLLCCRSNCNGLLSCHSLFYFDSLISPCVICSFTTFPCFPPCLPPPPWFSLVSRCRSFPDCSHLCSTKESSSPLVCVRSSQLFRNLCQMCVFYCPMPDQIPLDFFFFINQEDTLSWPLPRKK